MATVLVVDDDKTTLGLIKDVIELIGYEAITMTDAEFALESLLAGLRVDLLITDVIMPGMDGEAFVTEILKRSDTLQFPILMISGRDMAKDLTGLLETGRVTFLQKPIPVGDMITAIHEGVAMGISP